VVGDASSKRSHGAESVVGDGSTKRSLGGVLLKGFKIFFAGVDERDITRQNL